MQDGSRAPTIAQAFALSGHGRDMDRSIGNRLSPPLRAVMACAARSAARGLCGRHPRADWRRLHTGRLRTLGLRRCRARRRRRRARPGPGGRRRSASPGSASVPACCSGRSARATTRSSSTTRTRRPSPRRRTPSSSPSTHSPTLGLVQLLRSRSRRVGSFAWVDGLIGALAVAALAAAATSRRPSKRSKAAPSAIGSACLSLRRPRPARPRRRRADDDLVAQRRRLAADRRLAGPLRRRRRRLPLGRRPVDRGAQPR